MGKPWTEIGRYGGVGIEFVLTILIASWLGHWLDGRFALHGYGLGVGFLVGVAVAFRLLFRTAQGMQRDIERAEARDPGSSRWTVDPNWLHKDPSETAAPSNTTNAMPPPKDDNDAG